MHRVHGRLAVGAYPGFVLIGPGPSVVGASGGGTNNIYHTFLAVEYRRWLAVLIELFFLVGIGMTLGFWPLALT